MKYSKASLLAVAASALYISIATAQDCTSTISASEYPAPSLAAGWAAHIVANDFIKPRSLKRDINGHLLVVDQAEDGGGITRLTFEGEAPCLTVSDRQQIIANGSVRGLHIHGVGK